MIGVAGQPHHSILLKSLKKTRLPLVADQDQETGDSDPGLETDDDQGQGRESKGLDHGTGEGQGPETGRERERGHAPETEKETEDQGIFMISISSFRKYE